MKIDVVYTWVDGNDPQWQKRKEERLKDMGMHVSVTANHSSRFVQHDELKYSLRSIHEFAPWVNKIFIITDKQIPAWFDKSNDWAIIVDHTEIFDDSSCLPTFNASALETKLHKIPGLSEYYLYFNDDLFLGRPCKEREFVTKDGKPFAFVAKYNRLMSKRTRLAKDNELRTNNEFQAGLANSRKLIYNRYGTLCKFTIAHAVRVYKKSIMNELEQMFYLSFSETASKPFRTGSDILSYAILSYYLAISKKGKMRKLPKIRARRYFFSNLRAVLSSYFFSYVTVNDTNYRKKLELVNKYKAFMFCINDDIECKPNSYTYIQDYLMKKYPNKSPAEI